MLGSFKIAIKFVSSSEKDRLIQEAEEAYYAEDEAKCIDAIARLYELFDNNLMNATFQIVAHVGDMPLFN